MNYFVNKVATLILLAMTSMFVFAQKGIDAPIPSTKPSKYQEEQIKRKYGMFIHFGINTFHDEEWTDGTKLPETYTPTTIDAKQWVETAKKAGMKYIILVAKHHDGFCLWDCEFTEYDVANSPNKTNVVEEVAKECEKQGIRLGLYYSIWDRNMNPDIENFHSDGKYNEFMLKQLGELIDMTQKHTKIVELWLDGGWLKHNYRWPVQDIYTLTKKRAPQCQVAVNWTIGHPDNPAQHLVLPEQQKEMYPFRYFPSDFRLGDPYLPADPDPKLFMHDGKVYYLPWETTVVLGQKWFYHTEDNIQKSVDELVELYNRCTAQDNILILNVGPNREGRIKDADVNLLMSLKDALKLK